MATVWSLNYHEVLEDPRVLKQARVLAAAGHDLTVFSHFPEGQPKSQEIDGFKIHRFDWPDYTKLSSPDLSVFEFLKPSSQPLLDNFNQLVDQVEQLRSLENAIAQWEDITGPLSEQVSVYEKRYYEEHSGLKRLRRRIRHKKALKKLTADQIDAVSSALSMAGGDAPSIRQLRKLSRAVQECFRELYQGKSLVFAANLLREEPMGEPDIVHAHDIYTLPAGVLLAKKHGCCLIYDAHELEIERATISSEETKKMVDLLERACLEYVDALITVSDAIGEAYSERYKRRTPIIIMNAPELEMKRSETRKVEDIRSMSGLSAEVPLVIFTGGIQREHRGVNKVLQALTYLPDVHLAILGARHERNDAQLLELAQELNVLDRIHMHDPVDARDVVTTISTATVSVIPFQAGALNHEFAMPNKLFEAAFARVPLAVSNLTEMRRFVESLGIGRSMDQADPKSIAAAIQDVLRNPQQYQGIQGIEEKLEASYSWNAQAKKLTDLYKEILQTDAHAYEVG